MKIECLTEAKFLLIIKFKKSWLVKKLYQIKIKNEVLQTQ